MLRWPCSSWPPHVSAPRKDTGILAVLYPPVQHHRQRDNPYPFYLVGWHPWHCRPTLEVDVLPVEVGLLINGLEVASYLPRLPSVTILAGIFGCLSAMHKIVLARRLLMEKWESTKFTLDSFGRGGCSHYPIYDF